MIQCSLNDKRQAVDSYPVWTGNNAQIKIQAHLCRVHVDELDSMGMDFDIKYSQQFMKIASEQRPVNS